MKVYVASKFENAPYVKELMEELEEAGHSIVGDWTSHTVEGLTGANLVRRLTKYAEADLQGIEDCDALVLLPVEPERVRSGAHLVELGYALGRGKLCCVMNGRPGAPTRAPIFFFHPCVQHFDRVTDLLMFLSWAEEGVK